MAGGAVYWNGSGCRQARCLLTNNGPVECFATEPLPRFRPLLRRALSQSPYRQARSCNRNEHNADKIECIGANSTS